MHNSKAEVEEELARKIESIRDDKTKYKHIATLFCEITKISNTIPSDEERRRYTAKYNPVLKLLNSLTVKFYESFNRLLTGNEQKNQQDTQEFLVSLFGDIIPSLKNEEIATLYRIQRTKFHNCGSCGLYADKGLEYSFYITYNLFTTKEAYGTPDLKFEYLIQSENNDFETNPRDQNLEKSTIRPCKNTTCTNINNMHGTLRSVFIINKLPQLLTIYVPRFVIDDKTKRLSKNNSPILKPNDILTLQTYAENLQESRAVQYKLLALICHIGELNGGHYYCIAQRYPGEWYELNDEKTQKINNIGSGDILKQIVLILYDRI